MTRHAFGTGITRQSNRTTTKPLSQPTPKWTGANINGLNQSGDEAARRPKNSAHKALCEINRYPRAGARLIPPHHACRTCRVGRSNTLSIEECGRVVMFPHRLTIGDNATTHLDSFQNKK